jgi:BNR repeat-like domain
MHLFNTRHSGVISVGGILALLLILVVSLSTIHPASTLAASQQSNLSGTTRVLSTDPYTNSTSQHHTEVEPDTYSSGSNEVSAYQAGRFFSGGGSTNIGWAVSHDAGTTWKTGFLTGTTIYAGGTYDSISDPAVAYDPLHKVWLISSLGLTKTHGNDVLVSRSSDGGLTWSKPGVIAAAGASNAYLDKDWIVCDTTASSPYYGHCYAQWDNRNINGGLIQMSTSTDGGLTWSPAASPPTQTFAAQGGQPLVQPGGKVIVPIYGQDLTNNLFYMYSYTSTDGGQSWTNPVTISQLTFNIQTASYRGGSLPSAEIDKAGKVYMVWDDCRFEPNCTAGDIVLTTSTDGTTWSPVQRIPIDPVGSGVDHFTAGIGVDGSTSGASAHLGVTFYYFANTNCNNNTCKLYAGFVSSTNAGASWSKKVTLVGPMSVKWLANTDAGYMTGDYISTSIVNSMAVPVFAAATAPKGTTLHEFMDVSLLAVVGGSIKMVPEPVQDTSKARKGGLTIPPAN